MKEPQLDMQAKQALVRMADTLEDINLKLDHIIRTQAETFYSHCRCAK